ncbi:enoyl-CoA hydratase/isomerase family protein [Propionivibrio sp.]|uniref:enoyl-CoA hydratase/isomerase family protein n=1 Tax=Propionivibrio sp. TaxID=2212460 RepID=UPI00345B7FA6
MAYLETVGQVLQAIEQLPQPTIAAIQGPCAGAGLEIASVCDLRIAGHSARFGAPVMKLGFFNVPR